MKPKRGEFFYKGGSGDMKAQQFKPSTKVAEWNTMLAHRLRVQSERNERLKVRMVGLTVLAFGTGFLIGVSL